MNTSKSKGRERPLTSTVVAGFASLAGALAAGVGVAVLPTPAHADTYTTADMQGRVLDSSGAPVSGAQVTIVSGQGVSRTVTTSADGSFTVNALAYGLYNVSVVASGFQPSSDGAITLGGGSNSFDFTVAREDENEAIVVTAARATRDFNRTDTGISVDVQELSERVPLGRSIFNVTLLTPTAQDNDPSIMANGIRRNQSMANFSGTSAAESAYYINGLNVTDQRTFLGYTDLPFDAIQSVEVKTGGYSAEFGRATGGIVNIVTRSGENEFHGGAAAFVTAEALRSEAGDTHGPGGARGQILYNRFSTSDTVDSSFWLSGPIIPDRVFFFGMVNPTTRESCGAVASNGLEGTAGEFRGTQECSFSNTPRWLGKIDVNLSDTQRIEMTVLSDADKTDITSCASFNVQTGNCTTQGSSRSELSGGTNQIYRYTGAFTDWFTLSALYGQVRSQYTDQSSAFGIPLIADQRSGSSIFLTPTTNQGPFALEGEDIRDTYRVDADFYVSNLFGDHHFKVGYDSEELLATDRSDLAGGASYQIRNTSITSIPVATTPPGFTGDYVRVTHFSSGGSFEATQNAFYVQDSWQPTDRLTLQLGIRNDMYDYRTSDGESYINSDDQWAPRLGFTYDPFGDSYDKIYGSYGNYYLPIAENTSIRIAGSNPFDRQFYALGAGPLTPTPPFGALLGQQVFSPGGAPDPRTIAAQNIQPMYTEEFSIGWEHTFRAGRFEDWQIGVNYMDRNLAETVEDTNLQHHASYTDSAGVVHPYGDGAVGRYCQRTGISAANCNIDAYEGIFTLINPGRDQTLFVDVDGTGARYVNFTKEDFGFPGAENHYQALTFTFERPFDGTWGLRGSYVWSHSQGNYEGAVKSDIGQTDTSITQDFDNTYVELGADGDLPNDRRHAFRLFGTYSPIENLMIGTNFRAQSGRPFGCVGYHPDDSNPPPTPSSWFCSNGTAQVATPRGSRGTTPWTYNVDLSLAYRMPMANDEAAATLYLDVFNVFDSQETVRVVEQGDVAGSSTPAPGAVATPLTVHGLARTLQAPRTVRFGVRYAF